MVRFSLGQIRVTDVAGAVCEGVDLDSEIVRQSLLLILESSTLCSIATVSQQSPHINTAYFAYSDALDLSFLSHPMSHHCRNLQSQAEVAVAVFSSAQPWGTPGRGLQLFGAAKEVSDSNTQEAEEIYSTRFPGNRARDKLLDDKSVERQYRLYMIRVNAVKIMDEVLLGDGRFVHAPIER